MNKIQLSIVILARNEEENIAGCIKSVSGLKTNHEIIVVDDLSTDSTKTVAVKLGARVLTHHLNSDFSLQRNWALTQTKSEWVLFLDADERLSPPLIAEIDRLLAEIRGVSGAYLKRVDKFCGFWLKHGEIGAQRLLRLAKNNSGVWEKKVDEVWAVSGKVITLSNPILHYSHPNLSQFLTSINDRSTLNAKMQFESGERVVWYDWFKPAAKFMVNYVFRLGFLDGLAGFVFAVLMSFHSFLVRGKLYLLWKKTTKVSMNESKRDRIVILLWFLTVSILYFQGIISRLPKW